MDPIAPLINSLHAEGRLRVWSLVITVFGDAVQHRGGRIATMRLQHLLARVRIEPGALRTALSRLARDGWMTRDRQGRNSFYRLSAKGVEATATASALIYAAPDREPVPRWRLAAGAGSVPDGIRVGPGLWLTPATGTPGLPEHLCVEGALTSLPDSFARAALGQDHIEALRLLFGDLDAMRGQILNPLDALAARTLLLHRWRRLVLRYPKVPPELFPAAMRGRDPRAELAALYTSLAAQSEYWLDSEEAGLAAMPPAQPEFARRFAPQK